MHPRDPAPERDIPKFLSGKQIDGGNRSPRRSVAGKTTGRKQRRAKHRERRSRLPCEFAVQAVRIACVFACTRQFVLRYEFYENWQPVRVHEEQMALHIVGGTSPIDAPHVAWEYQRAFQAGRSEDVSRPGGFNPVDTPLAFPGVLAPSVVGRKS